MNKFSYLIIATLLVNILGCPAVDEKQKAPQPDPGAEVKCRAACDRIGPKGLNCEEGQPIVMKETCSADGGSRCKPPASCAAGKCVVDCVTFCVETTAAGAGISPECVSRVKSCAELDACRLSP